MRALLLLCFVAYANAQIPDLGNGVLVHFGPFDTSYQVGNLSERYLPLEPNDEIGSENARELAESLRRLFKVGFNFYPPLDPYTRDTLPTLSLNNYLNLVSGKVDFRNLVLVGAQQFQLNLLELRFHNGRVDFEYFIPGLDLDVDLQINLLLGGVYPINFSVHLRLELTSVNVTGAVHAVAVPIIYQQENFQLDALYYNVHIEDVGVQITGSHININKIIKDSVVLQSKAAGGVVDPAFINKLIHDINANVAQVILHEANNMLFIANTDQVLAYLLPNIPSVN